MPLPENYLYECEKNGTYAMLTYVGSRSHRLRLLLLMIPRSLKWLRSIALLQLLLALPVALNSLTTRFLLLPPSPCMYWRRAALLSPFTCSCAGKLARLISKTKPSTPPAAKKNGSINPICSVPARPRRRLKCHPVDSSDTGIMSKGSGRQC